MSEGRRYVFEFSGDFVELVVAPIPKTLAEHWLTRGKEELLAHAYGVEDEEESSIDAPFLSGAETVEGCELRNGTLTIYDSDGDEVDSFALEGDRLDIDDYQELDPETHLVDGGPTLIRRTCYSGEVVYRPETPVASLDQANWYVFVKQTGAEPFICAFNFGNDEVWEDNVAPEGNGRCYSQEVWLRVPNADGSVREIYHAQSPEQV